jgi:hypothetical protein
MRLPVFRYNKAYTSSFIPRFLVGPGAHDKDEVIFIATER